MMGISNTVFVGIHGSVVALDKSTGTELWRTNLKGSDFVNVAVADDNIFATTKGALFCLDQATGQIRWQNPLKGLGFGLSTIAIPGVQSDQTAAIQKKRRDQQAAAAGAAAAASA
jgi:outer membrane protein assembly factor BamB